MSYIHSRLFDDAAEIIQTRRERDYVNLYRIVEDLLKELAQLFDDLNKKVNFCRKYYNLIQEFKKFSEFYTQFQRLSFYLDYHEKQLIVDLKDKINSCLWFIWVNQLVQSDSLKEIHFYLIHLNNDQRVIQKIKNKIKRVDNVSKTIFHKATIVTQQSFNHLKSDHLKSRDAILTSVKEADILVESCFICHKSDHSSKECFNRSTRINAVNKEYDCFDFDFDFDFDSKKLVISSKVIKKIEIISLCKLDEILLKENYFEKSFLIDAHLIFQKWSFSLCSLIDSDSVIYMIIHFNLINKVCKKLRIQFISLTKEKLIKDYDEKISKKIITHKILLNLIIESHKKLTVSMLIADIDYHEVILSKLWMNKNEILLNMWNDVIVFLNQLNTFISIFSILFNSKHSSWLQLSSLTSITQTKISMMLKRLVSITAQKESFSIQSINVALFKTLLNCSKKNKIKVFALFMININRKIAYNTQCNLNALNIFSINETTQNLEDIKAKLLSKYHKFLDVFDRAQLNKLFSHRFYDHKIELTSDFSICRKLWISWHRNCRALFQIYYWIQTFLTFSNLQRSIEKSIEKSNR